MRHCLRFGALVALCTVGSARLRGQSATNAEQASRAVSSAAPGASFVPRFRVPSRAAEAADHAAGDRKGHIARIVVGIVVGGALGAVVGNEYAHDHRPICESTPGGRCVLNHPDHSRQYRLTGIGVGALIGAEIGEFFSRRAAEHGDASASKG